MSRAYGLLSLLLVAAMATGCGKDNIRPPKVVYVEVEKPQDIPNELTEDCPIENPKTDTVEEMRRVAHERKLSLQACNIDKAALRKIDPVR